MLKHAAGFQIASSYSYCMVVICQLSVAASDAIILL